MRKKQSNYCALPFVHVAVEGNGHVKGCCLTPSFVTDSGEPFNLNRDNLADLYKTKDYLEFRQSFRENKRSPKCKTCWMQEDQGLTSLRKTFTKRFGYLDDETEDPTPSFIEIKMGNRCNLMCAICHPGNSSKWVQEIKRRDPQSDVEHFNQLAEFVKRKGIWDNNLILHAKEFHLMGGEPFAIKEIEEFVDLLIEKSNPRDIKLWFNTNGTIYPEKLISKFRLFNEVSISVSLDDIGKRMEYQRYYANFEKVINNIKSFGAIESRQISTHIDICWSNLNSYYFKEIAEFCEDITERHLHTNRYLLQHCRHFYTGVIYTLNNLGADEKVHFEKSLLAAKGVLHSGYGDLIDELLSSLRSDPNFDDVPLQRKREIYRLDQTRKVKFAEAFPELDAFMGQSEFNRAIETQIKDVTV